MTAMTAMNRALMQTRAAGRIRKIGHPDEPIGTYRFPTREELRENTVDMCEGAVSTIIALATLLPGVADDKLDVVARHLGALGSDIGKSKNPIKEFRKRGKDAMSKKWKHNWIGDITNNVDTSTTTTTCSTAASTSTKCWL